MNDDNPFVASVTRYLENADGSQHTYARAGISRTPDGRQEPSVVLFRNRFCLAVLTPEDAIRISNELIDQAERPVI